MIRNILVSIAVLPAFLAPLASAPAMEAPAQLSQQNGKEPPAERPRDYTFDKTISRSVLENYLARSISMEGLLNGRGDLDDNIRMLKTTGAKFIGRAICLSVGARGRPGA